MAQQQQTVLRVQTNKSTTGITEYDFLDLNGDVPIKINKSFAELSDISKRNSDYSIGLSLPGSKKNNAFFENFFNVDTQSLYFDVSKRVNCNVLINDESYFTGYLRLNKVSVLESKIEYSVTLYSSIGDLFGNIGNNLLKDLNFGDSEFKFNHIFTLSNVTYAFNNQNYSIDGEYPLPYIYPIVHNGYEYTGATVNLSGSTTESQTRLYTTTGPLASYATPAAAWAAGVKQYRINSPTQGILDNQLKPALNIWSLIQLIFKTYGYSITSDFMNTPWMKTLYMYGYFSSTSTKFAYTVYDIQELPLSGVEVVFIEREGKIYAVVCKLGTGIPCYCTDNINVQVIYNNGFGDFSVDGKIPYGYSGETFNITGLQYGTSPDVAVGTTLAYFPVPVNTSAIYTENDYVDFSLVIDQNIKQIDLLASIAKKFNLVFVPDPDVKNRIKIESYDFYMGTGNVYDWTDKLSWDKGYSVEPALNYIESELILTEQEDGDEGNKEFKNRNNRIYGENRVYNPTDFKSQTKKIDTIFSPEIIRKWDATSEWQGVTSNTNNVGLPLGINYVASSQEFDQGIENTISWFYKGVKTKPKLFFFLGDFNPFLDVLGENYDATNFYRTYDFYVSDSDAAYYGVYDKIPTISHTMPMGNVDSNKINNDSLCILFNSEEPLQNIGVTTYNVYTENDAYNTFYSNRVSNLYNPNTRYLGGYFDLSLSDVNNLKPNDLIKVNEQYFTWDKIDGYNLTTPELTKVNLVQFNANTKQYPDRYFQYYYCDNPTIIYKFKTNFTEANLLNSNFGWSTYYDHQIGILSSGSTITSGFTSTFKVIRNFSEVVYIPYTMYEVNETTYNTTGFDWENDPTHQEVYSDPLNVFGFSMPTYWLNATATRMGVNLFLDCSQFISVKDAWGILVGSSIPGPYVGEPGRYIAALGADDYTFAQRLYYSKDYGQTWIQKADQADLTGYAVSLRGNILYTCKAFAQGNIFKSVNYADTFVTSSAPVNDYTGIDCSSDGRYVVATFDNGTSGPMGYITSTDYGSTWTITSGSTGIYNDVDVTENGVPQFFARGSISGYNAGPEQITKLTTIGLGETATNSSSSWWNNVKASENGQVILATNVTGSGTTPISAFLSTDSGTNYSDLNSLTSSINNIGISKDGSKMVVSNTRATSSIPNTLFVSSNSGSSWTQISSSAFPLSSSYFGSSLQSGLDLSSDGQYIGIPYLSAFNTKRAYLSPNFGTTFTALSGATAPVFVGSIKFNR